MNPQRGKARVSIGLVLQASGGGDVVIAIRGTEGIREWVHDAEFLLVKCPFLAGAGHTENGFTAMYLSMTTAPDPGSPGLTQWLYDPQFPRQVTSLTICGHSLGGALATLLALDVAANTPFKNPAVYTYASPRTGGPLFASTYNQSCPIHFAWLAALTWFQSCHCRRYTNMSTAYTSSTQCNWEFHRRY